MLCMVLAAAGSFRHARTVADQFIGPPSEELQPFQSAPIPIARHPITHHWGWVFAYGDQNHDGVEVYVSPSGKLVGTNPPDLAERLRQRRDAERRPSRPTT
jgi:hypothetical protein